MKGEDSLRLAPCGVKCLVTFLSFGIHFAGGENNKNLGIYRVGFIKDGEVECLLILICFRALEGLL